MPPGGQVLALAFTYQQTRKGEFRYTGRVVAGGDVRVAGRGGPGECSGSAVMLAGAKTSPFSVLFSVLGFVAVAALLQNFATHPESLRSAGIKVLEWVNQFRNKPLDHGVEAARKR